MGAKDALSTREKTLAVATELFAERGFLGVSLAQVAEGLGLSKQAVLHHFSSKEKLYAEVLAQIAVELENVIATAQQEEGTPEAQLMYVFDALHQSRPGSRMRTKLLVRELMDVGERKPDIKTWHLRTFLDALTGIGRSLSAWSDKSDTEVFAALYQLIGAVSYFAISESTLSGMYGRTQTRAIRSAFSHELQLLIKAQTNAPE